MMSFPPIMLVLLILAVTPPSLLKTALAIGVLFVPPIARVVRSVTLDLMGEDFVEAARSRGGLDGTRPHTIAWLETIHARPAYGRALERGGPYAYA